MTSEFEKITAPTRKWAQQIMKQYDLGDHHRKILIVACLAWDRLQEARREIEKTGIVTVNRAGTPVRNPAVSIERDAQQTFLRALRELGLDVSGPEPPRGPPAPGIRWRS